MKTTQNAMTSTTNRWGRLYQEASSRHGVVTHAMADQVGLSPRSVQLRARAEGWRPVTRGAWLMPGAPNTPAARAAAHLLVLGDEALVSHVTAAHLHGLLSAAPTTTQLIVPAPCHAKGRAGAEVRRTRTLASPDITIVNGLRATSVPRTLRDLAGIGWEWDPLWDMATEAEQRRLARLDAYVEVADRLRHGPGGGRFHSVVQQRVRDRSDSGLERDTRTETRRAGFAPSDGPFPIRVARGELLYLDVAFPAVWFAIECDGFGFHRDRQSFERDRERWQLAQRAGWRLTWVTRRRLRDDLVGILEEVAEAHRLAGSNRPAAVPAI